MRITAPAVVLFLSIACIGALGDEREQHAHTSDELKRHGEMAMGFDQDKATHHFLITADGGTIRITANDANEKATVAQIRVHLQQIAVAFKRGDFEKPLLTHGEMPAGVDRLRALKRELIYRFNPSDGGGTLRIRSRNAEADRALRDFLTYQIREHNTGDPVRTGR